MASNITKNFKAKAGLRMSAGGALGGYQPNEQISTTKLASGMLAQEQASDKLTAMNSLSNTDMSQLAGNQPYHADGSASNAGRSSATPGSAAARSMAEQQLGIQQKMTDASNMSRLNRLGAATGDNTGATMYRDFLGNQRNRGNAFQFGLGLRAGGVVDPAQSKLYKIDGPGDGSGVDDEVDVNVHGKKIKVSKNERFAVFPASIPAESIEEFIESQTGEPSATAGRGLRDGMEAFGGAVATGVTTGLGVARYLDSFPSLRGKATASDSNAELAGTPQHQAVQNEERVAGDDAWEKRHGNSLGAQHARVTTGAGALRTSSTRNRAVNSDIAVPSDQSRAEALAQGRNEIRANQLGLSAGQLDVLRKTTGVDTVPEGFSNGSWTSKNDVAGDYNDSLRGTLHDDAKRLADGQGIASMRQKDGSYKNVIVDGNPVYTGADGKPTTSWYDTQAYKDAVSRAQQDKQTLRSMQQDRLMRDLGDDIKDPRVKAGAIAGLAAMNEQDKTAADKAYKAQGLRVQQAQLERDLRKDAQTQSNADRTHNAGRDDKFKARVDDLLKSSSTVDGKLDNARYSAMQQYAAKIPREMVRDEKTGEPREMDDNEYYAWLVDNMSLDQGLGVAGEHWFSVEKPWAGERTRYVRENASGNLRRGAPMQSIQYRDPDSGRIVYQSDIEKLSPSQQKAFYKRVEGN